MAKGKGGGGKGGEKKVEAAGKVDGGGAAVPGEKSADIKPEVASGKKSGKKGGKK